MSHIYESLSRILEIWNAWASFDPWFPRPSSGNENPNWLEIFGKVFQVYPFWLLRVVERTWARHDGRTMRGLDRTLPFPLQFELRILVFRLRIRDVFVLIRPNLVRISIFAKIRVNLFYLRFNPYPWILKKKSKTRDRNRARSPGEIRGAALHHLYIFLCRIRVNGSTPRGSTNQNIFPYLNI